MSGLTFLDPNEAAAVMTLVAYSGFALLSYVVPGPDWAVIVPRALDSRALGLATAAGVQSGLLFHGGLAAIGVYAIFQHYPEVLDILKVIGGLYIMYLGWADVRSWRENRPVGITAGNSLDGPEGSAPLITASPASAYGRGLLVNVLNPKAALFFFAVLPQFIPKGVYSLRWTVGLASLDIVIGFCWWLILIAVCQRAATHLKRGGTVSVAKTFVGGLLMVIGLFFVTQPLFS